MKSTGLYIIRSTDFYGEFHEAIAQGVPAREFSANYKPYSDAETLVLKSGMKLLVRWPDGKVVSETIKVVSGHKSIRVDMMGGDDNATTQEICAVLKHHGVEVLIPLKKGMQVRLSRR